MESYMNEWMLWMKGREYRRNKGLQKWKRREDKDIGRWRIQVDSGRCEMAQHDKGSCVWAGLQWGRNNKIKRRYMRLAGGPQSGSALCTKSSCAFPGEEQSPEEEPLPTGPRGSTAWWTRAQAPKPDLLGLVLALNPFSLVFHLSFLIFKIVRVKEQVMAST